MKGRLTWKPAGLRAKRWREVGQVRAPIDHFPPLKPPKDQAAQGKAQTKWASEK